MSRLPAPLRVAGAQLTAVAGDVATNAAAAAGAVLQAVERGCRVLVLPELFLGGYDLALVRDEPDRVVLDADTLDTDPRLEPLRQACARTGVTALVGAAVSYGGRRAISVLAVRDRIQVAYDKQHLDRAEAEVFDPGADGALLEVDGWPLGLAVCYDGCFPEHARAAADAGALAYLAPVAYYAGAEHRQELYYRARALDNSLYVVVSGLTGACGERRFAGGTSVVDPEGRVIESVPTGSTGLAVATLDAEVVRGVRATHTMTADHRDDLGTVRTVACPSSGAQALARPSNLSTMICTNWNRCTSTTPTRTRDIDTRTSMGRPWPMTRAKTIDSLAAARQTA